MESIRLSAFDEGHTAYNMGYSDFFNPYDQLDGQYDEWRLGGLLAKNTERRKESGPTIKKTVSDDWSPFD